MADETEDQRKSSCPRCRGARGQVVTVTEGANRYLTYQCPSCNYQWERPRSDETFKSGKAVASDPDENPPE